MVGHGGRRGLVRRARTRRPDPGNPGTTKIFDPHEGVEIFNVLTDEILANPRQGHERAFKAMEFVAKKPENGALMVRICCAVSEADGKKSLADQIEIVSLCSRLGIEPP